MTEYQSTSLVNVMAALALLQQAKRKYRTPEEQEKLRQREIELEQQRQVLQEAELKKQQEEMQRAPRAFIRRQKKLMAKRTRHA